MPHRFVVRAKDAATVAAEPDTDFGVIEPDSTPATTPAAPTPAQIATYNQQLLDYYRRVMQVTVHQRQGTGGLGGGAAERASYLPSVEPAALSRR